MEAQGFSCNVYDTCVYMKKVCNKIFKLFILVIYVNEMIILANDQFDVNRNKNQLKSAFKIKNLDKSKSILKIYFHKNMMKNNLWSNQWK